MPTLRSTTLFSPHTHARTPLFYSFTFFCSFPRTNKHKQNTHTHTHKFFISGLVFLTPPHSFSCSPAAPSPSSSLFFLLSFSLPALRLLPTRHGLCRQHVWVKGRGGTVCVCVCVCACACDECRTEAVTERREGFFPPCSLFLSPLHHTPPPFSTRCSCCPGFATPSTDLKKRPVFSALRFPVVFDPAGVNPQNTHTHTHTLSFSLTTHATPNTVFPLPLPTPPPPYPFQL